MSDEEHIYEYDEKYKFYRSVHVLLFTAFR